MTEFMPITGNDSRGFNASRMLYTAALTAGFLLATVTFALSADRDNNPPGPVGGPGTNWENPPGPVGGPGASPDRRRWSRVGWRRFCANHPRACRKTAWRAYCASHPKVCYNYGWRRPVAKTVHRLGHVVHHAVHGHHHVHRPLRKIHRHVRRHHRRHH